MHARLGVSKWLRPLCDCRAVLRMGIGCVDRIFSIALVLNANAIPIFEGFMVWGSDLSEGIPWVICASVGRLLRMVPVLGRFYPVFLGTARAMIVGPPPA